jgi:hypothetical protein
MDLTTSYIFKTSGGSEDGYNTICGPHDGMVLRGSDIMRPAGADRPEKDVDVVVLCEEGLNGVADHWKGSEDEALEPASFKMVKSQVDSQLGMQLRAQLEHVWSVSLLHELLHVAFPVKSMTATCPCRGGAYGVADIKRSCILDTREVWLGGLYRGITGIGDR